MTARPVGICGERRHSRRAARGRGREHDAARWPPNPCCLAPALPVTLQPVSFHLRGPGQAAPDGCHRTSAARGRGRGLDAAQSCRTDTASPPALSVTPKPVSFYKRGRGEHAAAKRSLHLCLAQGGRGHVNVAAERLPNGGCRAPFPNALNLLVSTSEVGVGVPPQSGRMGPASHERGATVGWVQPCNCRCEAVAPLAFTRPRATRRRHPASPSSARASPSPPAHRRGRSPGCRGRFQNWPSLDRGPAR